MALPSAPATRTRALIVVAAIGLGLLAGIISIGQALFVILVDWHAVPQALQPASSIIGGLVDALVTAVVGALIAIRRPKNVIGWLLLVAILTASLTNLPSLYRTYSLYIHPGPLGAAWLAWISNLSSPLSVLVIGQLLIVIPLLFPDGRLLSRRWLIPIMLFGGVVIVNVLGLFDPMSTAPLANPLALNALDGLWNVSHTSGPFSIVIVLLFGSGVVSLFVRYWLGTEQVRQQVKWLLVAVALLFIGLLWGSFVEPRRNGPGFAIVLSFLPIAIGIAVLRYRLYDIDLIINKAIVYGGLAVLITTTYVLIVIGVGAFVGSSRQLLLSIIATLLIAVSFQPLRQRTQQLANRLVYGKRATPYETLSQFSDQLSESFTQEGILERMVRLLAQATGAQRAEVWIRSADRLVLASASPAVEGSVTPDLPMNNGALPAMERDRVAPVTYQGELLGALAVAKKHGESMNAVEQQLVSNLAAQAGLVLKNVGLNRELLSRLEDLRASRQRLVTAQDEERRRIERDLHDGAQQHLVALKVKVGLAEGAADPEKKARFLAELKQDADTAIDQLRELARGVYPPLLAADGLEAALRAHLRQLPVPAEIQSSGLPRQPREVEGAIYFCCLEALQNVSKYAAASKVQVQLWATESMLGFLVEDDGKGFDLAKAHRAHGIENMRDRLEALGGTLAVRSVPGEGTRVEGSLPIRTAAGRRREP